MKAKSSFEIVPGYSGEIEWSDGAEDSSIGAYVFKDTYDYFLNGKSVFERENYLDFYRNMCECSTTCNCSWGYFNSSSLEEDGEIDGFFLNRNLKIGRNTYGSISSFEYHFIDKRASFKKR